MNNSNEKKGSFYCRSCYGKNFGPKVYASSETLNRNDTEAVKEDHDADEQYKDFKSVLRPQQIKASAFIPYNKWVFNLDFNLNVLILNSFYFFTLFLI